VRDDADIAPDDRNVVCGEDAERQTDRKEEEADGEPERVDLSLAQLSAQQEIAPETDEDYGGNQRTDDRLLKLGALRQSEHRYPTLTGEPLLHQGIVGYVQDWSAGILRGITMLIKASRPTLLCDTCRRS